VAIGACETSSYRPGELRRFWPRIIEPEGRIYFAGAYCDNLNWGQEAAHTLGPRIARPRRFTVPEATVSETARKQDDYRLHYLPNAGKHANSPTLRSRESRALICGVIASYFVCLFVHQNRPATSPQRLWDETEDGPASDFAARKLAALVPASERSAIQNAVVQI